MNGRPLGVQFKRNSAYVAQEDCFVPTMSAWETLKFTATLTLPKAVSPEERRTRIEEVLKIMGLWRSRDTQASDRPSSLGHCHKLGPTMQRLHGVPLVAAVWGCTCMGHGSGKI